MAVRSAILASSDSLASCFLEATVLEKDLGIWSDPSLKFSVHVTNVVNKANQILGLTKIVYIMDLSLMKTLIYSPRAPTSRIWQCCMAPVLEKDI